jgi:hypothetical protein
VSSQQKNWQPRGTYRNKPTINGTQNLQKPNERTNDSQKKPAAKGKPFGKKLDHPNAISKEERD